MKPQKRKKDGDILDRGHLPNSGIGGAEMPCIEGLMLRRQLRWTGHVKRMADTRLQKKSFSVKRKRRKDLTRLSGSHVICQYCTFLDTIVLNELLSRKRMSME